jgi:hypothetical protein
VKAASAFYRRAPDAGNKYGAFLAAASANEVVEVWPENWRSWTLFMKLCSQWSTGMGGRTGLRYESLYPLLDRLGLSTDEWNEMFEDVRAMEGAALEAMHAQ